MSTKTEMWAVVRPVRNGTEICNWTVARTRTMAIRAYLLDWDCGPWSDWRWHHRKGRRCVRVTVTVEG